MPGPIGSAVNCFCPEHINGSPRRFEGGHSYRAEREVKIPERYRWRCKCGAVGSWITDARATPPYHLWLEEHLPAGAEPAL